jgi:hypothetical protein
VQPLAKRLDDASTARAILVSMMLMASGVMAAAAIALTGWLAARMPIDSTGRPADTS